MFYLLLLPYSQNVVQQPPLATPSQASPNSSDTNTQTTTPAAASSTQAANSDIPACLSESIFKTYKNDINLDNGDEIEKVFFVK